jgi:hypothetical protein
MIRLELPEALYPVFDGPARYRGAYGGRGSAKSWAFARMAALKAYEKPRRILCARELQNSIKDSVHKLLAAQIEQLKLSGFQIGESFIRHVNGSEFIFKGLRTNTSEIKSMEGIDIAWVEEAQKVSQESWEVLIPTIRKPDSEIWITFNPEFKTDPTSQRFIENPPPNSRIVKINFDDNPWFPEELRQEMEYLKSIDFATYKHVWEGEYKDPGQGGKVVPGWSFANVQEVPYQPEQRLYLTCDFNVDPMCWGIAHIFSIDGQRHYHFFDEIALENTNIIETVKEFAKKYAQHPGGIIITGDASGNSRTDGTPDPNQTRYSLLLKTLSDLGVTRFALDAPRANPSIESRIQVFNAFVCNSKHERRVKVDPRCRQIINNCENLHFIPGSDKIWQPTPKQIELDNRLKFQRQDMFDAISYLVNKYDPKIERVETQKPKPKVITTPFRPK